MVLAVHHVMTTEKTSHTAVKIHPIHNAKANLDLMEVFFIVIPPIGNRP